MLPHSDAVLVFCATAADVDGVYKAMFERARASRDARHPLLIDGESLCEAIVGRSRRPALGLSSTEDVQRSLGACRRLNRADVEAAVHKALQLFPSGPIEIQDQQMLALSTEMCRAACERLEDMSRQQAIRADDLKRAVSETATAIVCDWPKLVLVKLYQSSTELAALDSLEEERKVAAASRAHLLRNATFVFIATSVAESSLTLDRVHTVVDMGVYRDATGFPPGYGGATLDQVWISEATSRQRRGRAGRTASPYAGFSQCAYCLYTRALTRRVGPQPPPALLLYPPMRLVLRLKVLVQRFPNMVWSEPKWPRSSEHQQRRAKKQPRQSAAAVSLLDLVRQAQEDIVESLKPSFRAAFAELHVMGVMTSPADDPHTAVTWSGEFLAQLPSAVGPDAGLFVLAGLRLGSLPEALAMAAASAMFAAGSLMFSRFEAWKSAQESLDREQRKAHAFSLLGREGIMDPMPSAPGDGVQHAWSEHILAVRIYLLFRHLRRRHGPTATYRVFRAFGLEPSFPTDMHAVVVALCETLQRLSPHVITAPLAEGTASAIARIVATLGDRSCTSVDPLRLFSATTETMRRLIIAATGHSVAIARVADPDGAEAWRQHVAQCQRVDDLDPVRSFCLSTARAPVTWTLSSAMLVEGSPAYHNLAEKPLFSALAHQGLLYDPGEVPRPTLQQAPPVPCAGMAALRGDGATVSISPAADGMGLRGIFVAEGLEARTLSHPSASAANWLFRDVTDRSRKLISRHGGLNLPRRLIVQLGGGSVLPTAVYNAATPLPPPASSSRPVEAPSPFILAMLACSSVAITTAYPAPLAQPAPNVEATIPAAGEEVEEEEADAGDDADGTDVEGADVGDVEGVAAVGAFALDPLAAAADRAASLAEPENPADTAFLEANAAQLMGDDPSEPAEEGTEAPLGAAGIAGAVPWLSPALLAALETLPAMTAARHRELAAGLLPPQPARPFLSSWIPGTAPPTPLGQPSATQIREPRESSVRPFHPDELAWTLPVVVDLDLGKPNRCFPVVHAFAHARLSGSRDGMRLFATVSTPLLEPDWRRGGESPALKLCGMNVLWSDPRSVLLSLVALRPCTALHVMWAQRDPCLAPPRVCDVRITACTFDPGTLAELTIEFLSDDGHPLYLPRLLRALQVCWTMRGGKTSYKGTLDD